MLFQSYQWKKKFWKFCILRQYLSQLLTNGQKPGQPTSLVFFLTYSCRFLHPNYLFQFTLYLFQCIWFVETSSNKFKKNLFQKLFCPFTAWINFSQSRSEQFMRQNTLSRAWKEKVDINKSFYYDSTIISSPHGFMTSRYPILNLMLIFQQSIMSLNCLLVCFCQNNDSAWL